MTKDIKTLRILSRRDTLKVVILPAAAALSGRYLAGCSAADGGETLTSMGSGDTSAPSSAASSGTSGAATASTATSTVKPAANSGSSGTSAAASSTSPASTAGAAGKPAANSSSATAGSSAAPAAGSGGALAQAGSPAGGAAGGAAAQAGASAGAAGGGAVTGVAGPGVMWATGGTGKLATSYPDPFEMGAGTTTSCKLYPTQTIGPCYADDPMMRSDISDGLDGLPVRLSFLVVGQDKCTPVPNATVDIWHSGSGGIYSAYAMGTVCNPGTENVLSKTFCRGVQPLDETGRVSFSTVFPGWYKGRTIHIHFTVRVGGKESVTSQLYFEDSLVEEILAQGIYKARGTRDTTNASDMLFTSGGATAAQVLMDHAKRPDGILHAWKVLSLG